MGSENGEEETQHFKFKIVLIGDTEVGKTSLARHLAHLGVQTQWVLLLLWHVHDVSMCTNLLSLP